MASARFAAAAPIVLRSKSLLAAGVKFPAASDRRGVHEGGGILPFLVGTEIPGGRPCCPKPNKPAFARKLLDALFDNL